MHHHITKPCLNFKKNLVNASHISDHMRNIDKEVREKNLLFLNEVGVDPGIDHIGTMKIVSDCDERNEKYIQIYNNIRRILEFESWCGGIPSPEFCDNPLGFFLFLINLIGINLAGLLLEHFKH